MDDRTDLESGTNAGATVVLEGEFVTVTADGADHPLYQPISDLLKRIRQKLSMDVVFVSQFVDGVPMRRHLNRVEDGVPCDPLEELFAQHVADCRHEALAHEHIDPDACITEPVVADEESTLGTLCCAMEDSSDAIERQREKDALHSIAKVISTTLRPQAPPDMGRAWASSTVARLELR
ncbi:hypothetical protein [Ramlibacter albus]|uniref:Uncharacterized protein n=1 Tax=Ramlibacter albus TaxID=2079448 RepID=A0A923MCW0_9BURK|nr:hypothetical protein [Ramlibacter albus]MBC5767665.1 hypothetical protein [Ramlibacter albus]